MVPEQRSGEEVDPYFRAPLTTNPVKHAYWGIVESSVPLTNGGETPGVERIPDPNWIHVSPEEYKRMFE